jgi:superfamily II DNA helicase RecQ
VYHKETAITMDDDFGLSSDDETELLALAEAAENGKRKHEDPLDVPDKRVKAEQSTSTGLAQKVLKERFGLDGFRLKQEAAITRLLDGGSTVIVFPTGAGKSLCYQVKKTLSDISVLF